MLGDAFLHQLPHDFGMMYDIIMNAIHLVMVVLVSWLLVKLVFWKMILILC